MKNEDNQLSYWEKSTFFNPYDLIIVGAGIVGLSAAIFYKRQNPNQRIGIVDSSIFPKGASSRNAGFACFGSMTELLSDINENGLEECLRLVEKRWRGLKELRKLVGDKNMEYAPTGGFEIFLDKDEEQFRAANNKIEFVNDHLKDIIGNEQVFQKVNHSFGIKNSSGVIKNSDEGQLHPGKMVEQLLKLCRELDIRIHRGFELVNFMSTNQQVILKAASNHELKSRKLLIATNGFSKKLLPTLDIKPARNQVLLSEPIPNLQIKGCFHYDQGYIYFRNVGNSLLIGGGRHWDKQIEETDNYGSNDLIIKGLLNIVRENLLPTVEFKIKNSWSGVLGVGKVKSPIIEFISPNVLTAVRMGGMGIAIGTGVGKEAAELLTNI